VITFDDGWRDNLTQAWPVLQRYNARATIFLVADWVNRAKTVRSEILAPDEVRLLADQGVEMGAHTMSHPRLDAVAPDAIDLELAASKAAVATWTGRPCRTFAYPYGRFGDLAVQAASRHFDAAVVVGGGWWSGGEPLARIPRISIHDDMTRWIPMFEARLSGGI
jgi:peptidoglycan/xylan/chitin deacetylase (PgdA/CDA1 family)